MLVDNDDGAKDIKKKLTDKDFTKPFLHHLANLYVVPVPSIEDKKNTEIEDLFDKKVLEAKVDGKSFNRIGDIDSEKEYGKIVFAKKVVEANQENINFSDFEQVIDRFKLVIEDYTHKKASTEKAPEA